MKWFLGAATVVALAVVHTAPARAQADSAARRQQRKLDSLASAVQALQARLDSVAATAEAAASTPAATPARAAGSYMNIGFDALTDAGTTTAKNVRDLNRGDHDPAVKGFTIPNAELTLDGTVDPYFKGFANLLWKLDENGETQVELEEVYAISTSLPWNLQVKAGQFVTEFGRQNAQHPHAWAFVDQPVILNRVFGPDGLRSQGARVSWLAPTSFYTEIMFSVLNPVGESAFSFLSPESGEIHGGIVSDRTVNSFGSMLFVPRITSSIDLSDTQTLVGGVSAAFGPNNAGTDTRTAIYGADLYYKWKPERAQAGFPFVSWQTEVLARNYKAGVRPAIDFAGNLPNETLTDHGGYTQLLWGIRPRVIAGLRGDYANGNDAAFDAELRSERTRISPNLTWYPSEFSKLRLQYNYDHRAGIGNDHSVWLQFEFMIGAHAAHKF
jgi:hypothetical protein